MKHKFKIGNIVKWENEFSFNLDQKVISVGVVLAVHIITETCLFLNSHKGDISYTVSGIKLMLPEKVLSLVIEREDGYDIS
jgi:hypothetical protein